MIGLKTLTRAEVTAIVVCILFMTAVIVQRFLPVRQEAGFSVLSQAEKVETADPGHFIDGMLCINSATSEELCMLPGIGEKLAQRIIEYREANGPFESIEELDGVYGVGEGIISGISDLITLEEYYENTGS